MRLLTSLCALAMAVAPASALSYERQGDQLLVRGEVNSSDLAKLKKTLKRFPNTKTLVLIDVPGSADDETNVQIMRLVRERGLNTHLTSRSMVASGGTDLFLSGAKRTMERGAQIGAHSWADGDGVEGAELDDEDPAHDLFLDTYEALGISENFYFFTLDAAPADDMHFMSEAEIEQFGILTAPNEGVVK